MLVDLGGVLASFSGLPTIQFLIVCSFLLTVNDQKLDSGKAWERG